MKRVTISIFGIMVILVIFICAFISLSEDNDGNDRRNTIARPADYFGPKILLDHNDNVYFFWLSNAGYDYYENKADLYFSKIDKDMHIMVYNKKILTNLTSKQYYVKVDSENNFHISLGRVNCTYLILNSNGDIIANTSLSEAQIFPDLPIIRVNDNEVIYLDYDGVVDSDKNLSIFTINYDRYNRSNYRVNDGELRRDILMTKYCINGNKIIENKTIFSISVDRNEYLSMYPIEELDNNQAWTLIRRRYYSKNFTVIDFAVIEANLTLNMNSGNYRTIYSKSNRSNRHDLYMMLDTDNSNKRHILIVDKGFPQDISGEATVLYKSDYLSDYYIFYWDQKNDTMIDFKVDSDLNLNLLYIKNKELYYKKMKIDENQPAPIVLQDGQTTSSGDYSIRLTPTDDKTAYPYMCSTIIYSTIMFPFLIFIRKRNKRMAARKYFFYPPYDT